MCLLYNRVVRNITQRKKMIETKAKKKTARDVTIAFKITKEENQLLKRLALRGGYASVAELVREGINLVHYDVVSKILRGELENLSDSDS